MKYILNFMEMGKEDVAIVGGKGANLGEMTRAGIRIPAGVVVTSKAYQYFMMENNIDVFAILKEKREHAGAVLQNKILAAEFPKELKEEITGYYRNLTGETGEEARVAVRSSATAEDLEDASFAGQQETYLNVRGEEMLFSKIKECYASLFGERAIRYREVQGYGEKPVCLAVVIQKMIESEKAGVLFTINPSNQKDELYINASYGLGEAVVSGLVTPDEYILEKDGTVKRINIGKKEQQILYDEKGTKRVKVPEENQKKQVLNTQELKMLARQAENIVRHYGFPCDIEWAFYRGELFILQSRCITTVSSEKEMEIEIPPVSRRVKKSMTFLLEKEPFAYYPLDYDFANLVGRAKPDIFKEAGIIMDDPVEMSEEGIMKLADGKIKLSHTIFRLPFVFAGLTNWSKNKESAEQAWKKNYGIYKKYREYSFENEPAEVCIQAMEELCKMISENAYARFRYAVFPAVLTAKKLEGRLKKVDASLSVYDTLVGLSYKTAVINREIKILGSRLRKQKGIAEKILAGNSYEEICRESPEVESVLGDFLEKHGGKSDYNCYCFTARTWREDKNRFLKVLAPVLSSSEEGYEDRGKDEFKKLMKRLPKKLHPMIRAYRFSHYYREETQYLWECTYEVCRRVYSRLEEIYRNQLAAQDDLLYLFYPELKEACKAEKLSEEIKERIAFRRKNRIRAEQTWEKIKFEILRNDQKEGIHGMCGSVGMASGTVCIVCSPKEFGKLKQGDILVCPYTDPEWTPLFTLAAGVVSDTGGTLSHAAIVAREYGIPAVLGTGDATHKLKDGDQVTVNGERGEVYLVKGKG